MGSCEKGSCGHGGAEKNAASQEEEQLHRQLQQIQHKLLVMSGKGGVGKSSVAVYIALGLANRGYKVGLMDVDLHGPSTPRMLGITGMFGMDEHKRLIPHRYNENLEVVSIEYLLEDRDSAVIWRGPIKHGVIKQFISEVNWGKLDYLVIDCPPGTGDEPLSVAQTIPDAHAVIVTTPQEVALADVRKSINFCRKVQMSILGLVENMDGLVCPHCGKEIDLFRRGGGRRTAERMQLTLLGSLPFDPRVVEGGDAGRPFMEGPSDTPFIQAVNRLIDAVEERCLPAEAPTAAKTVAAKPEVASAAGGNALKVAIPTAQGVLCNHFGHCEQFAILSVKDGRVDGREWVTPPPHEPGLLPRWLANQGIKVVISGGMGQRAISQFAEQGIRVVTGAPVMDPDALLQKYLDGSLETGPNVCDH
ncbi:iron-sulfur cluster carrier protein MrpORP [Desulfoglaeba alkanexedens]|uniref:Iron-sulfur cluster carrier protein n=1 Tax=Desulfoglaeba alkanexedens ALDC TaxID=980445 RepID=A0A4P8L7X9_9BACT|nr:iron-sulfur cluster carrier protein MrpORP [Desulfoglaeba alkanexedens]QCQ22722.1 chromosome partitioning protein ParA [Desulfoglaeba alkanexedens ALDC]